MAPYRCRNQKIDLEQKLKDFGRKGNGWLELSKRFFFRCNEAESIATEENIYKKIDFLKKLGSNRLLTEKKMGLKLKEPWDFVFRYNEKVGANQVGALTQNASEGGELYALFTKPAGLGFEPR